MITGYFFSNICINKLKFTWILSTTKRQKLEVRKIEKTWNICMNLLFWWDTACEFNHLSITMNDLIRAMKHLHSHSIMVATKEQIINKKKYIRVCFLYLDNLIFLILMNFQSFSFYNKTDKNYQFCAFHSDLYMRMVKVKFTSHDKKE